ncbi:PilW family protein [Acinetobacter sp. HY1485]|uniref:PilW family protein n=1 Tax=Acinetobacter sp. HY1485 TaxID=2970918 RepID=UPI0022B95C95|nr:prepilin-type N-terminal cleavage/methylation domain-containing protein [Acinetobacter sp. HY1485]
MQPQRGYTLVELMVALVLGLLLTAASLMIFLSTSQTYSAQKANSEIEKNGGTGLNYIIHKFRLIASNGGIVAHSLSTTESTTSNVNNDEITITYTVSQDRFDANRAHNQNGDGSQLMTCDGRILNANDNVRERYFVQNGGIFCQSTLNNQLSAGTQIVPNVDYFHVVLITQDNNSNFRKTNLAGVNGEAIVGLQMGVILHSDSAIQGATYLNNTNIVNVIDQNIQLRQIATHNLKQLFVQTIALRQ